MFAGFLLFCALVLVTGRYAHAAWRWRYRAESAEADVERLSPRPKSELEIQLRLAQSARDYYKRQYENAIADANANLWEREIETLPGLDD